jgi:hypothetical protein
LPALFAPLLTIVEAKKNDIESCIGQCVAQMVGARLFNDRAGKQSPEMSGCVTTGETWQFPRLQGTVVGIDWRRLYLNDVQDILAALLAVVSRPPPAASDQPK